MTADTALGKSRRRLFVSLAVLLALVVMAAANRRWLAVLPNSQAEGCLLRHELDQAAWWMDLSQRITTSSPETQLLLSRLSRKRGQLDEAARHLERARQLGVEQRVSSSTLVEERIERALALAANR